MKPIEISWQDLEVIVHGLPKASYKSLTRIVCSARVREAVNLKTIESPISEAPRNELTFHLHINSDDRYCWQLVTPITIVV